MTYEEYTNKIVELLKIRVTNYRLTQNDIAHLMNFVFEDIATEVIIDVVYQDIVIEADVDTFDLDALYVPVAKETPLELLNVVDENNNDISIFFENTRKMIYKGIGRTPNTRIGSSAEHNGGGLVLDIGDTITFIRKVVPDISQISNKLMLLLQPVLIEGIILHTQDSIPDNSTSNAPSKGINYHAMRYFNAKKDLANKLPQRLIHGYN